jgi:hypothetical protein
MNFEIEYKLELFREEQPSLFDEDNKRYTSTPIGKATAEIMLQLINEMEVALKEKVTINYKQLREAYFNEHVSTKTYDGIPVVATHPHNLFEWFKEELIEYGCKFK